MFNVRSLNFLPKKQSNNSLKNVFLVNKNDFKKACNLQVFEINDIQVQIEQAFSNKTKSNFSIVLSDELIEKNVNFVVFCMKFLIN